MTLLQCVFIRMWGWCLQAPLTDYWTDFASENGFEKLLALATILEQVFIDQSFSFALQGPIHTNSPSQIIGHTWQTIGPILNLKTSFEKAASLTEILVQVFIDQSYSLTPQWPIRTKSPSPDNRSYRPPGWLLDRFWIWNRFGEGIAFRYKTGTDCYRPKLFVNPSSRANTHKVPIPR
jgi:hypothetical protein